MIGVNKIYCIDVLKGLKQIDNNSINTVITSPPYWGLRDYGKETETVWNGDNSCEHNWETERTERPNASGGKTEYAEEKLAVKGVNNYSEFVDYKDRATYSSFCSKCGGWKGQLGLEPNIDLYIKHLLQVTKEIYRILRKDGVFFLNHGDCYGGSMQGHGQTRKSTGFQNTMDSPQYPGHHMIPPAAKLTPKCMALQNYRLILKMIDEQGWILRNTIIWHKCLSGSTSLFIYINGKPRITTLKDAIKIKGIYELPTPEGGKTKIIKITKSMQPSVHITFRDGYEITCSIDHRFLLENGELKEAKLLRIGDIIKKAVHNLSIIKQGIFNYDWGWLIGLALAEASFYDKRQQIDFALNKNEIMWKEKFEKILSTFGVKVYDYIYGNSLIIRLKSPISYGIFRNFVVGNSAKNKKLSSEAWLFGKEFIRGILNGFLDGDGHYEKYNNRWRGTICRNNGLIRDLRAICFILGYRFRAHQRKIKYQKGFKWGIQFLVKKSLNSHHYNNKQDTEIKSIFFGKERELYDIEIENEPHLFCLLNGATTHNSNHMPSSVKDRFSNAYEPVFMLTKSRHYWFDLDAVRLPHKDTSIQRYQYQAIGEDVKYANRPNVQGLNAFFKKQSFNYRVREAKKEHFGIIGVNASEEEMSRYNKQGIKQEFQKDLFDNVLMSNNLPTGESLICAKCNNETKDYFNAVDWDLIPEEYQNKILCFDCYKQFKKQIKGRLSDIPSANTGFFNKEPYKENNPHRKRLTKIPEKQAESFGSPRVRYYKDKTLDEKYKTGGMRNAPEPGEPNAFNIMGKNPGDLWEIPLSPKYLEGMGHSNRQGLNRPLNLSTIKAYKEYQEPIANFLKKNIRPEHKPLLNDVFGQHKWVHWTRTALPGIEDWFKLKEILQFDDSFDDKIYEVQKLNIPIFTSARNPGDIWQINTQPFPEAHFACTDSKTEALTKKGWKKINEVTLDDEFATFDYLNEKIVYHKPYKIFRYDYDGILTTIDNQWISQHITPNHRVLLKYVHSAIKRQPDNIWHFKNAKDIKPYSGVLIPNSGYYEQKESIGPQKAELLGWIITEGCFSQNMGIMIYQSNSANPDNVRKIEWLLNKLEIDYTRKDRKRHKSVIKGKGYITHQVSFYIKKRGGNWRWIFNWINEQKKPKWELLHLCQQDLRALYKGIILGDGHVRKDGRESFTQKDDFIRLWFRTLCVHLGYRTTEFNHPRRRNAGTVFVTHYNYSQIHQSDFKECIATKKYKGVVWCPYVPNGAWIAKRNSKIFITGNTFPEALIRPMILSSCPQWICKKCGKARERITKITYDIDNSRPKVQERKARENEDTNFKSMEFAHGFAKHQTLGWADCGCDHSDGWNSGIVLDPFVGSGTTLLTALKLNRKCIGIELSQKYVDMAYKRIKPYLEQTKLST